MDLSVGNSVGRPPGEIAPLSFAGARRRQVARLCAWLRDETAGRPSAKRPLPIAGRPATAGRAERRRPIAVLTSIDADARALARAPGTLVIADACDPLAARLLGDAEVIWYALDGRDLHAPPHWLLAPAGQDGGKQTFDLFIGGTAAGRWAMPARGPDSLEVAAASLAAACHGFGVAPEAALRALGRFGQELPPG